MPLQDGGLATMLIVEPEEELRRVVVAGAALADEQDVWAVDDVAAAREVLADKPRTGVIVCRLARADEVAQAAPRALLVLLAEPGETEQAIALLEGHGYDVLPLPLTAEAAGEALRRAREQWAAELAADDAEAQLAQRQAEQRADDLALEQQEAELPRLERVRAELSAAVIGEMQACLRGVPDRLDQATARVADENTRAAIVDGAFASRSALHMVDDLLDVVRAERVALPTAPREVEVARLVDDALAEVARIAADYLATLEVVRTGEAARFATDPELARRAIENLVECGLRRSRKGRVVVEVDARPERLRVVVTDAGGEVQQPAALPALFTHHARLETGTLQRGASLGFCRAVAAALGGSVEAAAVPGGLRVAMELPPAALPGQPASR